MRQKYIQGIYGEIAGLLDQKLMDLENLLSNPVGIGEHGSISEEIKVRLKEVSELKGLKDTVESLFGAPGEVPNADSATAPNAEE
jgi:hypothetical protein|tara:strand:+ start:9283 stop:9537 length:255 start_codon:yes stop_codon:yes gene_type:complete